MLTTSLTSGTYNARCISLMVDLSSLRTGLFSISKVRALLSEEAVLLGIHGAVTNQLGFGDTDR